MLLTACNKNNVLALKKKKYFIEQSFFTVDSSMELQQIVRYNRPEVIDEEYDHNLSFCFLYTTAAKSKRVLNLEKDTSIVKTTYSISSTWVWNDFRKVKGKITIIKWERDRIVLKENVTVLGHRGSNKMLEYKGTRTFIRRIALKTN